MKNIRTYTDLMKIKTFEERYEYLRLNGRVGESTFGFDRYLNQLLYNSDKWKKIRAGIIIRDNAWDLGIEDLEINGNIFVHHMNAITIDDLENESPIVFDPEYLICTSKNTHDAIHFSNESLLFKMPKERRPNDTCPWR